MVSAAPPSGKQFPLARQVRVPGRRPPAAPLRTSERNAIHGLARDADGGVDGLPGTEAAFSPAPSGRPTPSPACGAPARPSTSSSECWGCATTWACSVRSTTSVRSDRWATRLRHSATWDWSTPHATSAAASPRTRPAGEPATTDDPRVSSCRRQTRGGTACQTTGTAHSAAPPPCGTVGTSQQSGIRAAPGREAPHEPERRRPRPLAVMVVSSDAAGAMCPGRSPGRGIPLTAGAARRRVR
jgi:hypothetical protein